MGVGGYNLFFIGANIDANRDTSVPEYLLVINNKRLADNLRLKYLFCLENFT